MLTRVFRFILPVMVISALLWALGATNATKDCNAAGMQQPYWNLIGRFAGWTTIIFNSVSLRCWLIACTELHLTDAFCPSVLLL